MKIINSKTKVYFGEDSLNVLGELKEKKIIIVADKFLVDSKIINRVLDKINKTNSVVVFDKVVPNPPLEVVSELIKEIIKVNADVIIGFGGGSSIDTAKGAIYFMEQADMKQKMYFIAIPTTSGTGSEVSSFTVITDTQEKIKHALLSDSILPDEAILDASFTMSLPKPVVANTGIDVLTHALEAYVAKGANPYSDSLSEKAGELVVSSLVPYYNNQQDKIAGENMHIASAMAGMSFNNAGLGINHSIAHQIGSEFHVPHGLANGLLLTAVMDFNGQDPATYKKYAKYARKIGVASTEMDDKKAFENLKTYITYIQGYMKMPLTLRECEIDASKLKAHMNKLCVHALEDNCTGATPVGPTYEDIKNILEKIL